MSTSPASNEKNNHAHNNDQLPKQLDELLSQQIQEFIAWVSPTSEECEMRKDVVGRIGKLVVQEWPGARVEVIGSCSTNLCVPNSDIDIVIFGIPDSSSLKTLYTLSNKLSAVAKADTLQVLDAAKVPLIKLTDLKSGSDVDISLSIIAGKENTKIIQHYVTSYPLLRPLTLIIKYFLKQRHLNNSWSGGIGSYTLVIMIISFLQIHLKNHPDPSYADLLLSFFRLYGKTFNYSQSIISVNDGGQYLSKNSQPEKKWKNTPTPGYLCVEDPQNPDLDIGVASFRIQNVQTAFAEAYEKLLNGWTDQQEDDKTASNPDIKQQQQFPGLSRIIWVDYQVYVFRQRILQIYGEQPKKQKNQKNRSATVHPSQRSYPSSSSQAKLSQGDFPTLVGSNHCSKSRSTKKSSNGETPEARKSLLQTV